MSTYTAAFLIVVVVAKLAPVGYGIMKLQITCVVEDDKVRTLELLICVLCVWHVRVQRMCYI